MFTFGSEAHGQQREAHPSSVSSLEGKNLAAPAARSLLKVTITHRHWYKNTATNDRDLHKLMTFIKLVLKDCNLRPHRHS